ncbi:MAG TPA: exosortase-associated EpsI family protein [Fimbriimonas sp.]|nr:exosortase-associated EpsI family protein [Fimbriimonas sp.]
MEGLTKRAYGLALLFLAAGIYAHALPPKPGPVRTEQWMEQQSLGAFDAYSLAAVDPKDPLISYRMDPSIYAELGPYGIVCREFTNGVSSYDVVLIGSQAKASFHDPKVCFTAQGWQLDQQDVAVAPTKLRGNVPVTVAQIHSDEGTRWAAFCYKGPYGFGAGTTDLKLQMFKYSLLNSKVSDGIFYRFISESDGDKATLLKFVGEYLDASAKHADGFF